MIPEISKEEMIKAFKQGADHIRNKPDEKKSGWLNIPQ